MCSPVWTTEVIAVGYLGRYEAPAMANGVLYAIANSAVGFFGSRTLVGYDAAGTGCADPPNTCEPLLSAVERGTTISHDPGRIQRHCVRHQLPVRGVAQGMVDHRFHVVLTAGAQSARSSWVILRTCRLPGLRHP